MHKKLLFVGFCLASAAIADNHNLSADSDTGTNSGIGTRIVGDQELPQVIYFVPWRTPPKIQPEKPALSHSDSLPAFHACDIGPENWPENVPDWACDTIWSDGSQRN